MQRQPKAIFIYFRMKDVDRRIEAIAQVNVESKEEKVERAEFNVPTCGHIAVCQRCRDRQIKSLFPTSSLFSTLKVRLRVCPGKPARQNRHMIICILLRHQCFSVVAQATPQDSCNASPRLFSNERRG